MKIIDVAWRTGRQTVGIVLIETVVGVKAYIGAGAGLNHIWDSIYIAENGCRLSPKEAAPFFPDRKEIKWAE